MAAKKKAKSPDAIALLKEDHKKVKGLLDQLEKATSESRREQLSAKIEGELKVHTTIEEEIFYPAYRDAAKKKDDKDLFFEAKEEHHVVDMVLPEVRSTPKGSDQFEAKAKVLKELVTHHAKEEEKSMFPRARKLLSKDELQNLGDRMAKRKRELSRG
jgi:hemerythrin-like domain-containing protein